MVQFGSHAIRWGRSRQRSLYDFTSCFFFWNFLNCDWMATAAFWVSGSSMSMSKSWGRLFFFSSGEMRGRMVGKGLDRCVSVASWISNRDIHKILPHIQPLFILLYLSLEHFKLLREFRVHVWSFHTNIFSNAFGMAVSLSGGFSTCTTLSKTKQLLDGLTWNLALIPIVLWGWIQMTLLSHLMLQY